MNEERTWFGATAGALKFGARSMLLIRGMEIILRPGT